MTERQADFIQAACDEVLFGGAAGGGKSYGQVVDSYRYAMQYAGSRQLILRRTMPELERTLIRAARTLYPQEDCQYLVTRRQFAFENGSSIEFGYCDSEGDVYRYQSAEYDVIRFDELTHFTEHMYRYLLSRLRGVNGFPKQAKSTTNPGGIGHGWVKRRFIDIGAPDTAHQTPAGTRIFLPAHIADNCFLERHDPDYKKRLDNLEENERRALLLGDWDIADGCYFDEWNRAVHVVKPFEIPAHWPVFFVMDYGLDMLAGYWITAEPSGRCCVFRELYERGLIISDAARRIQEMTVEPVREYLAPPDLWNRRQESGRSAAEIFLEQGLPLTKAPANRIAGWLELKEWLKPITDETGTPTARLVFFNCCVNAIRSISEIRRDTESPNDCALQPHELTHAPDAIRYFVAARLVGEPAGQPPEQKADSLGALLRYHG